MNLVKEILGSIAGVQIFGILSMVIFIITFILMIIHVFSMNKEDVKQYGNLPLENNEADNQEN